METSKRSTTPNQQMSVMSTHSFFLPWREIRQEGKGIQEKSLFIETSSKGWVISRQERIVVLTIWD